MLYLNNSLLTSEKIIAQFELNLDKLKETPPDGSKVPSALSQLKKKLKDNFFSKWKEISDYEAVLQAIEEDSRFKSNYPKLKEVLQIIFKLKDDSNKEEALEKLKAITRIDWDLHGADAQWDIYNERYHYFNKTPELLQLFTELACACRTMIVLFEENNTEDDTMAYEYAYKLMALFVDENKPNTINFNALAKETYTLLTYSDIDKEHPFHYALLVKLGLPSAKEIQDKAGWHALVKSAGIQAFYFLAMAQKIEEKIKTMNNNVPHAPRNIKEAEAISALCRYKRASEDFHFAQLCYRYKVDENRFNQCLDYLALGFPKKQTDTIADIQVVGEGHALGLYWVKVPVTDKRALILGDITDCCQSIGGHSEQCVKDAVTLADNSLYVLVKKHKKNSLNLIVNDEINDHDFKIIGQSYVWKSINGNICLDSIECLQHEISNEALRSVTLDFANQLLQNNPDIKYVTVGQGGKTPKDMFDKAFLPEKILVGYQYADSLTQYCIAKTAFDHFDINQRIRLEDLIDPYPQEIKSVVNHYSCYINDPEFFIGQLEHVETFVKQLNVLRAKFPELAESHVLDDDFMKNVLSQNDLMRTLQETQKEQRQATLAKMLEDAYVRNDEKKTHFLCFFLGAHIPVTESLIKKIDPIWSKRLMPSVEYILEKIKFVDCNDMLDGINIKNLADLVVLSFIDEANSESHVEITEERVEEFIKQKLKDINDEKNADLADVNTNFKKNLLELKESYDPNQDFSGPSIFEID